MNQYLIDSYNSERNEIEYNELVRYLLKYFNEFINLFEMELEENITINNNDFYKILKSRLFPYDFGLNLLRTLI